MTAPWDSIVWWEVRRIVFNGVLLVAGLVTLAILFAVAKAATQVGESDPPPLLYFAVPAYAIGANMFYTLGWLTELLWSGGDTLKTAPYRNRIFWLGLICSALLTLAPGAVFALFWLIGRVA